MKRAFSLFLFILAAAVMVAACGTTQQAQRQEKEEIDYSQYLSGSGVRRKVAVVHFENKTAFGRSKLGGVALEMLIGHLTRSGGFIVVERARIDKLMEEHSLQMSGLTSSVDALKLGEMLKADALVTGAVLEFGVKTEGRNVVFSQSKTQTARAVVQIRVIDVQSGRVLEAIAGKGEAINTSERVLGVGSSAGYDQTLAGRALDAAISQTVAGLLQQLSQDVSWTAYIAERQDDGTFLITAGAGAGVQPGDVVDVFLPGEPVREPNTGEIIGHKPATFKGKLEIVQLLGENISVARKIEGSSFVTGDLLMNHRRPGVAQEYLEQPVDGQGNE